MSHQFYKKKLNACDQPCILYRAKSIIYFYVPRACFFSYDTGQRLNSGHLRLNWLSSFQKSRLLQKTCLKIIADSRQISDQGRRDQWCRRWGCRRCKRTPKSFHLSKIRAKILKIRAKFEQNPWESGQKWRPTFFDFKKGTQRLQKNTWRPFFLFFFGGHTKKGLHNLCGRKFVGKVVQKRFGKNPSHS